jgi:alkylation response protein AidB-like acyl-CoA dehydrogenase
VEFSFTQEQEALRASAREVLEKEAGPQAFRRVIDSKTGFDEALWRTLTGLHWAGVAIPEADGGLGLGMIELCVLLEECGRGLLPAPFYSTVGLAAPVVLAADASPARSEFLRRVAGEGIRATLALAERGGRWDAAGVRAVKAKRSDGGWTLSGTKAFVPDAHVADEIVVAARTERARDPEQGISLFLVPASALKRKPKQAKTIDNTRRLCEVSFNGVELPAERLLGQEGGGWPVLARGLDRAVAALAAEAAGVGGKALEMAAAYAKEREQFGRKIGSFQAISHRVADMFVAVEGGRSNVYYAAWALEEGEPDAPLAAASAKVAACEGAREATAGGIQVHGGIGFTWEHDMHLYYRRAKWCELFLGDTDLWRDRIVSLRVA